MEAISQIAERVVGTLRPEGQGRLIGLNSTLAEKCLKHNTTLRIRRTYEGEQFVCSECEEEADARRRESDFIKSCHDGIGLSERLNLMTFISYIPSGEKEKRAKKSCEDYADGVITGDPGGMILLGGVGTGKTHLAIAICKKVCDSKRTAHLTSVPKIIRHIRSSWSDNATDRWGCKLSEDDVIKSYSDYTLLVIDEIGVQYGTPAEKISISEVINERYNRMRPTVLIGNVKLSEAEEFLGVRVVDRVKDEGLVLIFDWESHRKMKK